MSNNNLHSTGIHLSKQIIRECLLILFGGIPYTLSCLLLTSINTVCGSTIGLAIVLYMAFGLNSGIMNILMNIPIMILCTKVFGKKTLIYTIVIVLYTSVMLDIFTPLFHPPHWNHWILVVTAGVLMGIGAGMFIRTGGTMAGTTAINLMIKHKWPQINYGTTLTIMDSAICLTGVIILKDPSVILNSIVYVVVTSYVIDFVSFKKIVIPLHRIH